MRRKGWMGAALAAVVVLSLFYARFASRQIYRESVSRLEEVYGQVNAGMSRFSLVTLTVMALLFGILALGAVAASVHTSRRRVWEQDREIRSREELFDLLTENTEDIFVLFSPQDGFHAQYVSPNLDRVLGMDP